MSELDLWIGSVSDLKNSGWTPPREPSLFSSIALSQSPLTLPSYTTYLLRSHHWSVRLQKKIFGIFQRRQHWGILTLVIRRRDAVGRKLFFTFQVRPLFESRRGCESVLFPGGISIRWQLCLLPTSHFLVNPDAVVNLRASSAEVSMEVNEKWMEGKATV